MKKMFITILCFVLLHSIGISQDFLQQHLQQHFQQVKQNLPEQLHPLLQQHFQQHLQAIQQQQNLEKLERLEDEQKIQTSSGWPLFLVPVTFFVACVSLLLKVAVRPRIARAGFCKEDCGEIKPADTPISEEQTDTIRRHNALFENVPIHSGEEWKTLSVNELVEVCEVAFKAVYEMHGKKYPLYKIRQDTINRCRDLSKWMSQAQYRRFYMDSDMSHLIDKPMKVAQLLELNN